MQQILKVDISVCLITFELEFLLKIGAGGGEICHVIVIQHLPESNGPIIFSPFVFQKADYRRCGPRAE